MKNLNYERRKRNGIITSTIITIMILSIVALYIMLTLSPISIQIKFPLLFLASFLVLIVFPGFLFRFQFVIYNYLNKNIDIIEKNLSSYYKPIFLNTNCLKSSAISLHKKRAYFAKLEDDGTITIRIEQVDSHKFFEEQTTDYSWFLSLFSLNQL